MSVVSEKVKSGFTLIEINLVLLIVGVALVSLMGLFPVGLREADAASSDTEQAMFADRILNTIQAKANAITNAVVWSREDDFIDALNKSFKLRDNIGEKNIEIDVRDAEGNLKDTLLGNYPDQKSYMRYKIKVEKVSPNEMGIKLDGDRVQRLYRASVWVSNRKTGDTDNNTPYTTYLFYKGVK